MREAECLARSSHHGEKAVRWQKAAKWWHFERQVLGKGTRSVKRLKEAVAARC
jgi:hypothetical protein